MKTRQLNTGKSLITLIMSFVILLCLSNSGRAATTYVKICPDDTYRAAVDLDKRFDYQWQISSKSKSFGDWSTYTNIHGATSYFYNFSPVSYKYDYRLRVVVLYLVSARKPINN